MFRAFGYCAPINRCVYPFISVSVREIFERACAHADVGQGRVSVVGLDDIDSICPKRGPDSEGLSTRMVTLALYPEGDRRSEDRFGFH